MKRRNIFKIILIISVVLLIAFAFFVPTILRNLNIDDNNYYWHHGMMHHRGMMGGWMIVPILLVILIIYSIYALNHKTKKHIEDPITLLNRRYIEGKISEEEYLRKKKSLLK